MKIRLTERDYANLFAFARTVVKIEISDPQCAIDKTAQLLTRMVLQIEGEPPRPDEAPKPKRYRPFGSNKGYKFAIDLSQFKVSAPVRALWVWGHERGCINVAESFRLLMDKLRAAYPDLGKTPDDEQANRLLAFRHAIEEKGHFVVAAPEGGW